MCKVFVPKVCYYRKRIADPLLQRSNMSIEKRLSTGCTPVECYVHKQTCKNSDKKGEIILHIIEVNLAISKTMTVAHSSLIVLLSTNTFILHYPTLPSKKFDIANAEYQTRILPHSSLIVLSFSNHHKRQFKDIPAS